MVSVLGERSVRASKMVNLNGGFPISLAKGVLIENEVRRKIVAVIWLS